MTQPQPPTVPRDAADALRIAERLADGLHDGAAERDRTGDVPWEALAEVDASGLLALTVPAADGGAGGGAEALAAVVRTLAAADPAVAQVPQGHFLFVDALVALGTQEQRTRLLGEAVSGRRLGNALAERGRATAQDLATRLTRGADGAPWHLDGTKHYATGAISAHRIAVSALDPDDRLVVAFVARDARGVVAHEDWAAMGQRATVSGSLDLERVAVEDRDLLDWGGAFTRPQLLGARAQLVHAAIEVGIAEGALADAITFVTEKARPHPSVKAAGWDRVADDPHVVHRVGELHVRVRAAGALLAEAGRTLDALPLLPDTEEDAARGSLAVAEAKAYGSEVAVEVASELFSLGGASATDAKRGLDRHWRNARTHSVHDPVRWKYHHLGDFRLNGTLPPNHGQL